MTRKWRVDLDGVLADFDGHYEKVFGMSPNRGLPNEIFWKDIEQNQTFFRDMPKMHDADILWNGLKELGIQPTILTGLPLIDAVEQQKRDWVAEHIGPDIEVICTRSRLKAQFGNPGDVLIDDWDKYQHLWEKMGGIFILHKSAHESLHEAKKWVV